MVGETTPSGAQEGGRVRRIVLWAGLAVVVLAVGALAVVRSGVFAPDPPPPSPPPVADCEAFGAVLSADPGGSWSVTDDEISASDDEASCTFRHRSADRRFSMEVRIAVKSETTESARRRAAQLRCIGDPQQVPPDTAGAQGIALCQYWDENIFAVNLRAVGHERSTRLRVTSRGNPKPSPEEAIYDRDLSVKLTRRSLTLPACALVESSRDEDTRQRYGRACQVT
ncbi:hypothetical protein [Plantactinospora sp. GCM10030261]|uniref:hypothetical protein n=1 Tax=Plantactinospora sp. GCM10030261 TaxID=3273420 RepID=UPI0036210602